MRIGLSLRIAILVSLVLAIAIGAQMLFFSNQSGRVLQDLIGARLQSIASTAALHVDGDLHEQIHTRADARGDAFRTLRAELEQIARANDVKPHLVYTLRPKDQAYQLVVIAEEDVGNSYVRAPPEVQLVLKDGVPRHRGRYESENGVWISGFAPIRDHAQQIVGLVEVDEEISEYVAEQKANTLQAAAIAIAILLAGVMLVFISVRAATSRIIRLTELADAISRGDVEKSVNAMGDDEIGRLAKALERLRESVRTSLELLDGSNKKH